MKRLTLSLLTCSLILAGAVASGCGGNDESALDPGDVIDRAFDAEPATLGFLGGGQVEVTSLGFEDTPLKTRTLAVDADAYGSILDAIASPQKGLRSVIKNIMYEGTEEVDGLETDHVSGKLDITGLIDIVKKAQSPGGKLDRSGGQLPGAGQLSGLEETLVDAKFDLYAAEGGGPFERLDLTLSLDDRDNALPPTRIRFSLTESDPTEVSL